MSALGQKQTFAVQKSMSALPPKADMCGATRDVRFVPIADILPLIRSFRRRSDYSPILFSAGPTAQIALEALGG
jgi:hypothetical protein